MIKTIISHEDVKERRIFKKDGDKFLRVSELYYNTIQGEGINIGMPAAFLRLQGCPLTCAYCDTHQVWSHGSPYTYTELFNLIDKTDFVEKLKFGQHLVLTGGSPLYQQERLYEFLFMFKAIYRFKPYIEVENECILRPEGISHYIDCWNNSPKLSSSGVTFRRRYQPDIIRQLSSYPNSWFKFVIESEADWEEILEFFILPSLIKREQIILMPKGATLEELESNRLLVAELAVKYNLRYSSREHIVLWNKKIGV